MQALYSNGLMEDKTVTEKRQIMIWHYMELVKQYPMREARRLFRMPGGSQDLDPQPGVIRSKFIVFGRPLIASIINGPEPPVDPIRLSNLPLVRLHKQN